MSPSLRGIFLTSSHVDETARFYRDVAGLDQLEPVGSDGGYKYWKMDDGRMQLAIHDAAAFSDYSHPPNLDSNVTHLYFKTESHSEFLGRLERLGISPYAVDDVVITVVDPDGRKVMFGTA